MYGKIYSPHYLPHTNNKKNHLSSNQSIQIRNFLPFQRISSVFFFFAFKYDSNIFLHVLHLLSPSLFLTKENTKQKNRKNETVLGFFVSIHPVILTESILFSTSQESRTNQIQIMKEFIEYNFIHSITRFAIIIIKNIVVTLIEQCCAASYISYT